MIGHTATGVSSTKIDTHYLHYSKAQTIERIRSLVICKWDQSDDHETVHKAYAVWPDGYIICSIFDDLKQWKNAQ